MFSRAFLLLCPALLGLSCSRPAQTLVAERKWQTPRLLCRIGDTRVRESSGVAPSTRDKNVFFTHNDSGDGPRFYKFDHKGALLGSYEVLGAKAWDWEDMSSAKLDGKSYLYFGDIGDNARRRKSIQVYRVEEPKKGQMAVKLNARYELTYPDGAHNAEGMFVHPEAGDLYIVTKTSDAPAGLYRLAKPEKSGHYKLVRVGEVSPEAPSASVITGAAISPDGKHMIFRTYGDAYEYSIVNSIPDALSSEPKRVFLNAEIQGESIAYGGDGRSLLTTSEFSPCPVSIVELL